MIDESPNAPSSVAEFRTKANRVMWPTTALIAVGVLGATMATRSASGKVLLVAAVCGLIWYLATLQVLARRERKLRVGRDGILVITGSKQTFHGFADIDDVSKWYDGAAITLKNKKRVFVSFFSVNIPTRSKSDRGRTEAFVLADQVLKQTSSEGRAPRDAFVETARAALTRFRAEPPPTAPPELSLGHEPPTTWLANLRKSSDDDPFRSASVPTERLAELVTMPSVPAETRVGAAIALLARDPSQRKHVRIAAEGLVEPRLRVALEAAASDDAAALERVVSDWRPGVSR